MDLLRMTRGVIQDPPPYLQLHAGRPDASQKRVKVAFFMLQIDHIVFFHLWYDLLLKRESVVDKVFSWERTKLILPLPPVSTARTHISSPDPRGWLTTSTKKALCLGLRIVSYRTTWADHVDFVYLVRCSQRTSSQKSSMKFAYSVS